MTDATAWDGLPQNPEKNGWYWLHNGTGKHAMWWLAAARGWCGSDAASDACEMPPDEATDYYLACEPCHTPAEVAALVEQARREEREACAARADLVAVGLNPNGRTYEAGYANGAFDVARAIRARAAT